MAAVYKYPVDFADSFTLDMPKGAQILSVNTQDMKIAMWAFGDMANEKETRHFRIFGTGHEMTSEFQNIVHVGTVVQFGGELVWHIFEETND